MQNDQKPKILCLDDEADNLDALERIFRKKFNVLKATSAEKAFELLDNSPDVSVIVSDQRMPVITGVEFLERSIVSHPNTTRILLTGYADMQSVVEAVNKGQIYRYLTKPWDAEDLLNTVIQAHERYMLRIELKEKNQKLEAALEELKSLDKAKNQFMILINHELKTPLTAILSFGGLLQETDLGDEQKLFTDRILKSANKLKNIIDDVLLIVKGEVGMIPVKYSTIPAEWFTQNIDEEVAKSIRAKNQSLKFSTNFETVDVDPRLTQMAFTRALHNATKFGLPDSEIILMIHSDPQHKLVMSLHNKGPQISPQLIEKIMKPFQMDENIMNHSVGMGLGLSICNTLLKAQNASLKVQNVNDGVVVSFHFK